MTCSTHCQSSRQRSTCGRSSRSLIVAFTLGIAVTGHMYADEPIPMTDTTEASGEIPSFYVRAVTGPLAGKSVCYVCRNGDRPVVVVLLRELGPDAAALLKELDRTVNQHRADGLRCFAVLLTDTPQRDSARLQTLAFDEKIDLPLTLAGEASTLGSPLAFSRESAVSVVTYQDRRIVQRFTFKAGTCDETARKRIVAASEKLVEAKKE